MCDLRVLAVLTWFSTTVGLSDAASPTCAFGAVLPGRQAVGKKRVSTAQLSNPSTADEECCNRCAENAACEFWVHDFSVCSMYAQWTETKVDLAKRSGFKGHSNAVSGAFLIAYDAVSYATYQAPSTGVDVPPFFTNYRIQLPPLSNVVMAQVGQGNYVALLQDVKLRFSVGTNFSTDKGKVFNGSIQWAVDLEPQLSLDLNKDSCHANLTNAGIYNLGLGVTDRSKNFQAVAEQLSGPSHAALRNDCKSVLPALPGQQLVQFRFPRAVGKTLTVKSFPAVTNQTDLDAQCCEACNDNPECDAFETTDKWSEDAHSCTLRSYSKQDATKHANVRGSRFAKNVSGSTYDIDGQILGTHQVGSGPSSVAYAGDIDAQCADLCDQTPECEVWSADVSVGSDHKAMCALKRFTKPTGLANKWWSDGVSGQGLGNSVVAELWSEIMKVLLKAAKLCDAGASGELPSLMDFAADVTAKTANLQSATADSISGALKSLLAEFAPKVAAWVGECLDTPTKCSGYNFVNEVLV